MATIVVALPQIAGLMQRLGAQAKAVASKGVLSAANRARTIMEQSVRQAPPASARGSKGAVNTGAYLRSWKARREVRNGNIGMLIYTAGIPYAGVIEYGRRMGAKAPPSEALARWAQRKLGLPYKEAKRAAFAIGRAIKKRGLRPRHVLTGQKTQDALIAAFQEEVLFELIEAVKGLHSWPSVVPHAALRLPLRFKQAATAWLSSPLRALSPIWQRTLTTTWT